MLMMALAVVSGAGCDEGASGVTIAAEATTSTAAVSPTTSEAVGEVAAPIGPQPVALTVPEPLPGADGGPLFDYEAVATEESTANTALGTVRWMRTSVVPSEWLYSGFPTPSFVADPFSYDRTWRDVAEGAPCCLKVTRTDLGWIGVGSTDRTRRCGESTEVWTSTDGATWELLNDAGFGNTGPCEVARVVEFGGSAAVLGVGEIGSGARVGAVWVSHDLEDWVRKDFDFEKPGMETFVTSAVASPRGFALFGMRVSHEPTAKSETGIRLGPYRFEWAGWFSPDGMSWRSENMVTMFGNPWCRPNRSSPCGYINATVNADGFVAYVHQASDSTIPDLRDGWALWIGVFGD
jgi:hypothetical protein